MNKTTIIFALMLTGCAYRYGAGYFMNDVLQRPVHVVDPLLEPETTAQPVASAAPSAKPPCPEEPVKTTTLQVTNQIDQKNQTLTTTAVTESHISNSPCE